MHISFEGVMMMFTKKIIKISPRLLKLQLAKVVAFFETQCINTVFQKIWHPFSFCDNFL